MDDDILEEQRDLVRRIEAAGWEVTDAELSVYRSPWEADHPPEATATITARKAFPEEDDESAFRVS